MRTTVNAMKQLCLLIQNFIFKNFFLIESKPYLLFNEEKEISKLYIKSRNLSLRNKSKLTFLQVKSNLTNEKKIQKMKRNLISENKY